MARPISVLTETAPWNTTPERPAILTLSWCQHLKAGITHGNFWIAMSKCGCGSMLSSGWSGRSFAHTKSSVLPPTDSGAAAVRSTTLPGQPRAFISPGPASAASCRTQPGQARHHPGAQKRERGAKSEALAGTNTFGKRISNAATAARDGSHYQGAPIFSKHVNLTPHSTRRCLESGHGSIEKLHDPALFFKWRKWNGKVRVPFGTYVGDGCLHCSEPDLLTECAALCVVAQKIGMNFSLIRPHSD